MKLFYLILNFLKSASCKRLFYRNNKNIVIRKDNE